VVTSGVPDSIQSTIFCLLQISFSSLALAGMVSPTLLPPLLIIALSYSQVAKRFRPAARDMKRAETLSRSPIYTLFKEALAGVETIRSIPDAPARWSREHRAKTDENIAVYSTGKAFDRWLSVRLETLGNTAVFTAATVSVFLAKAGRLTTGRAGWGITQALSITGLLSWAVRCWTDLETQMMSVMRVTEMLDENIVPKELAKAGEAMPKVLVNGTTWESTPTEDYPLKETGWPWRGGIKFKNISLRYDPNQPRVLHNVTIDVPPGTTLGVVGRTGSGKSSLLAALFRLVDVEEGSIEIDGVDIRSVSLPTLRNNLSIIPQNPVLFAGTLAYNLDATGRSTPALAREALLAASPDFGSMDLQDPIAENGSNLSQGQRQLVCLARALLRKTKILVLDEATSSVDGHTDAAVQRTIKEQFLDKGATVIVVAHRLDTVLGCDQIAVLGEGRVLEVGTPSDLLARGGELKKLVDARRQSRYEEEGENMSLGALLEETPVAV